MMIKIIAAAATLACGLALATPANADVLLIEQVHKENALHMPTRGMTMDQVKAEFGAPLNVLPTRGGHMPQRPPINRWEYQDFTVYFERSMVIHSVINPPSIASTTSSP